MLALRAAVRVDNICRANWFQNPAEPRLSDGDMVWETKHGFAFFVTPDLIRGPAQRRRKAGP
ncbi:hypothetical protein, partial [Sphingopyxis sp.]|uniref:hypothetical protein n=1 Tax=Sphingopyxis sp. TaxID=1908224 RepID=UPI0026390C0B